MLTLPISMSDDTDPITLDFEHSLLAMSKWESIHLKPFYSKEPQTEDETLSYLDCMLVTENPPHNWIQRIRSSHLLSIQNYLNQRQTATTFRDDPSAPRSSEIVTTELVYYWLTQFNIPFTCETWNFSRLMTLIQVCGLKQSKPKKMNRQEQAAQMRELNAQRRQQMNTNG